MEKRSLFFDTSLIYFIVIVIFVGIRIMGGLIEISDAFGTVLNIVIQVVAMFLIPLLLYKFLQNK
ncbi:MAG: hypothetical protein J6T74_05795, partial [Clostridia bacterium]|nr:hypothetical protein [Clostridia bacterium]